jgi:hypothetical protein
MTTIDGTNDYVIYSMLCYAILDAADDYDYNVKVFDSGSRKQQVSHLVPCQKVNSRHATVIIPISSIPNRPRRRLGIWLWFTKANICFLRPEIHTKGVFSLKYGISQQILLAKAWHQYQRGTKGPLTSLLHCTTEKFNKSLSQQSYSIQSRSSSCSEHRMTRTWTTATDPTKYGEQGPFFLRNTTFFHLRDKSIIKSKHTQPIFTGFNVKWLKNGKYADQIPNVPNPKQSCPVRTCAVPWF